MSKPLLIFLLIVFSIHLAVFLRLARRHRKAYHVFAVATFILLLISTGMRLVWPDIHLGRLPLFAYFKYGAWLTTAALIVAYLRHRFSR